MEDLIVEESANAILAADLADDGVTYTFTLQDGVTFQDGSELTSEDVKYSLERSLNIAHPDGASFLISSIETIETPGEISTGWWPISRRAASPVRGCSGSTFQL